VGGSTGSKPYLMPKRLHFWSIWSPETGTRSNAAARCQTPQPLGRSARAALAQLHSALPSERRSRWGQACGHRQTSPGPPPGADPSTPLREKSWPFV